MIRFTALGGVDLRTSDSVVVGSVLNQPRRLALLAYLAVESTQGGIERDRLVGVFWPDHPEDQGRQALRTALHFLRRSLGSHVFDCQGTRVAINAGALRCDATEFRSAMEEGNAARALPLYRGDLLPGFHLTGGPAGYERWLDETREALRRSAAEAAWLLAMEQQELGNPAGAGALARRAAELNRGDEAVCRRSIEMLGQVADRAGALEVYEGLVRHLREEFDEAPSEQTRACIAVVRKETGAVPVEVTAPSPGGPVSGETSAPSGTGAPPVEAGTVGRGWARHPVRRLGQAAYSVAITVLLAVGFYSLWGTDRGGREGGYDFDAKPLIHVADLLDFSADPGTASLAAALTLELAGRLSQSEALRVVQGTLASAPWDIVSAEPTYLVRGGVSRSDSTLRVTAMLVDGASGVTLDRFRLERPLAGLDVGEAAETMAHKIRRQIGRAVDDHERGATSRNARALALVRAAVRDMELGDSVSTAGVAESARAAFAAADSQLALAQAAAPRWPEPPILRAEIAYRRMWLDLLPTTGDAQPISPLLRSGIDHANAALVLMPGEPAALEVRGILNYWLWLTRSAGSDAADGAALRQAEADLRRATTMDAGRGRAWTTLSAILESRADFAGANLAAGRAYRTDPLLGGSETLLRLFITSLEMGDRSAARQWCGELGRRLPGSWAPDYCELMQLAWHGPPSGMDADSVAAVVAVTIENAVASPGVRPRLQMLGAVALARAGSPEAITVMESARAALGGDPIAAALEAWAHLVLDDRDAAVSLLARSTDQDPRAARSTLQSRRFDVLRDDPRLQSLIATTHR